MDYAELLAKRLFERVLPGSRMVYHLDQSNGEHDFDLFYSDGRAAVVEVTIAIDRVLQETWRAILNTEKGGGVIRPQLCKQIWSIGVSSATRIGGQRFDRFTKTSAWSTVLHFPTISDRPVILIGLPGPPGRLTDSFAIEAAEQEAMKVDNRRKLGGVHVW